MSGALQLKTLHLEDQNCFFKGSGPSTGGHETHEVLAEPGPYRGLALVIIGGIRGTLPASVRPISNLEWACIDHWHRLAPSCVCIHS